MMWTAGSPRFFRVAFGNYPSQESPEPTFAQLLIQGHKHPAKFRNRWPDKLI